MADDSAVELEEPMSLAGTLADRTRWSAARCPAAAALDVVGSRSAMLIMREALYGTTRFDDFVERVGVTDGVAAGRLRELTELGLLARVPYRDPGSRTRYEYKLTGRGADFAPVVLALFDWGSKHLTTAARGPFEFDHDVDGCGARVHARMVCDAGHDVTPREVSVRRRGQRAAG